MSNSLNSEIPSMFEEIPVLMRYPFFGHKRSSLLHILDLEEMVRCKTNWDISKCGLIAKFREAEGRELFSQKCPICFPGEVVKS